MTKSLTCMGCRLLLAIGRIELIMPTPLIPQEIFLLERFCSLERYGEMRDAWEAMLKHAEHMLDRFMHDLPLGYRSHHQPDQPPDIVWGEWVLPNFRSTMQILNTGFIKLSHGDYRSLSRSSAVRNDIRGQVDFWSGWMNEVEPGAEEKYYELLHSAGHYAKPIDHTSSGTWAPVH